MIAPNSTIVLLKTPMELDETNTLTFATETAKYNYFSSLPKLTLTGATYQRENGYVRYPTNPPDVSFEDLQRYNYCMYQNTSYDSKWFYAFIKNIEYQNDGMSYIYLKTDTFMTWQNDITYKTSFIERQHVADDTIGHNLIPEDVETGEYIAVTTDGFGFDNGHLVICSAWNPFTQKPGGSYINGIYQGCDYFLIGDTGSLGYSEPQAISYFMGMMATQSKLESVLGMFMLPDLLTKYNNIATWDYMVNSGGLAQYPYKTLTQDIIGTTAVDMGDKTITKNYIALDGYVPKNNKLFTSQFNYLLLSNNSGNSYTYNYEDFSGTSCVFRTRGAITPGGSIKTFPLNYRGANSGMEYGINSGKYPICSFTGDMYTNWLTQNSVNIQMGNFDFNVKPGDMGIATGIMSIVGGAGLMATGAGGFSGAGSIVSGGMQIANSVGEIQRHQKMAPMVGGNLNAGDVTYAMTWLDITIYKMTIKSQFAKIIDDYFTMFGYKVNSVEVINPHKRTYYDYIKTIGCNITGNIPQSDLLEIKSLFDRGITLWHDATKFLDYTVNNSIVS